MPTWVVHAFYIRINPWKFGVKQFKIHKVIQHLLKPSTFLLCRSSYFQQTMNNYVNFDFLFTKLSGIAPYENALTTWVGMFEDMFLWLLENLKQCPIS